MDFDILVKGGRVINGEKDASPIAADLGIESGRIVALEPGAGLEQANAARVIDARGMIIAPGFIDVHIHSEIALLQERHRHAGLFQGVTTQLTAPDGFGWAPLTGQLTKELWESTAFSTGMDDMGINTSSVEGYLDSFTGKLPANLALQVPHCAVRLEAMGWEPRAATSDELGHMKRRVAEWMEAGAVSLCLGLDYQPSAFATTDELVELSKVAAAHGGIYAAHIRYNSLGRAGAWLETLELGRQANIPLHVSHEYVDDISAPLLEAGDDISFESYLYPAGCTHLAMTLPVWAQRGGSVGLRERLKDWAFRFEVEGWLERYFTAAYLRGERFVFVDTPSGRYLGLDLRDAACSENLSLGAFGLKVLSEEYPYATLVFHRAVTPYVWEDIRSKTLAHPKMMVASDGIYTGEYGHPRGYGCFAKVLAEVREDNVIGLPEAIYKMAGFPAERFRVKDRGFLKPGLAADVVIFDPDTVKDHATWVDPRLPPTGIPFVLVNGTLVIDDGQATDALPGKVVH